MTRIVLASGSPRRRELLSLQGFDFDVVPAEIDESHRATENAVQYVERLALEKARAVAQDLSSVAASVERSIQQPATLVIAADTIVEQSGRLLGKPRTVADAESMLGRLSGASHNVHTGVAVVLIQFVPREKASHKELVAVSSTEVRFHSMSAEEIRWYVSTGEPMDKAGAYGIQAHGALFVSGLNGSYFNVVGLPLDALYKLVGEIGIEWTSLVTRSA